MGDYGTFRRHFWALPLEVAMLVGVFLTVAAHDWLHVLTASFTFIISFAPLIFERIFRVKLPQLFQITYVLFVFLSMFCGEVLKLYATVRGWDGAMHALSGGFIGLGVILWLRSLIYQRKIQFSFLLQMVFTFSFGVMIATIWEIVEFGSDQIFGTTSQDRSLYDTMTDLVYGSAGTAAFIGLYYFFTKNQRTLGLRWVISHFEQLNR